MFHLKLGPRVLVRIFFWLSSGVYGRFPAERVSNADSVQYHDVSWWPFWQLSIMLWPRLYIASQWCKYNMHLLSASECSVKNVILYVWQYSRKHYHINSYVVGGVVGVVGLFEVIVFRVFPHVDIWISKRTSWMRCMQFNIQPLHSDFNPSRAGYFGGTFTSAFYIILPI